MFSEHISGESSTVFSRSSTGSRGLPPVVSWTTASVSAHSRSCSSPVDRRVHRVRAVGVARVDVQDRRARPPGRDALLDDLVGLLGQVRVGLLAVDAAGQGAGDDHRLGARVAHASVLHDRDGADGAAGAAADAQREAREREAQAGHLVEVREVLVVRDVAGRGTSCAPGRCG